MLHGSDLNKSEQSIKIKVKEIREAPKNFNSPAIIDFSERVHNKEAFAVNITNLRALAEMYDLDPEKADFETIAKKVRGQTLTLYKTMANNPKTNKMVYSLFFAPDDVK